MNTLEQNFIKKGYFVTKTYKRINLQKIKNKIFEYSKKTFSIKTHNQSVFFDNFHKMEISEAEFNKYRQNLNQIINKDFFSINLGFEAFKNQLIEIFGPDIVAQKRVNLVIQKPEDASQITLHRDAPPNSPYEIVVWVPLVNTYKSKNMYILDKKKTLLLLKKMNDTKKGNKNLMKTLFSQSEKKAEKLKLQFGNALFFSTALFHLVPINKEKQTRWSLNYRFKNLFSPYGQKKFIEYFDIQNSSAITKLALEFENNKYF